MAPLKNISGCVLFFLQNVKTHPLLENESLPYDLSCLW